MLVFVHNADILPYTIQRGAWWQRLTGTIWKLNSDYKQNITKSYELPDGQVITTGRSLFVVLRFSSSHPSLGPTEK